MAFNRIFNLLFITALTVSLSACSQLSKKEEPSANTTGYSANKLFQDARASLKANNYTLLYHIQTRITTMRA